MTKETNYTEVDLLIMQRNQLVDALARTNSAFHKTILAFFAALASIVAAEYFNSSKKIVVLFVIQLILMIILFVEALLISGNIKRYYISAIDDFLLEKYQISSLFYQGNLSRKHTIEKSFFTNITYGIIIITMILFLWILYEFQFLNYIKNNVFYIILVTVEVVFILWIMFYNFYDKKRGPKIYKECIEYLENNSIFTAESKKVL